LNPTTSHTTREQILREIGIAPVWKQRTTEAVERDDERGIETPRTSVAAVSAMPEGAAQRALAIAEMSWGELAIEIAQCSACNLCKTRSKAVPGAGHIHPKWVAIGAAPSESDDTAGESFTGREGALLDAMLTAVEKTRKRDAFVTSLVKCRPPDDREPASEELNACKPFLDRQIALAKPKLLLALGEIVGRTLLKSSAPLTTLRAKTAVHNDTSVIVTYAPADLLRTPTEKAKAWEDLLAAKAQS
jgi:uracil-DNA glycosylase